MFTDAQRLENYRRLSEINYKELSDRFNVSALTVWRWLNDSGMSRRHRQRLVELEMEYLVSEKSLLSPEAKRMLQDGYARVGKSE